MPRRSDASTSYEQTLVSTVADDLISSADRHAASMGAPPNTTSASDRERVRLWGRTDPKAPYDQVFQMLTTTGVPPEMMEQMQIGRFAKSHPELVQAYSQPTQDTALAARLADLAEYPFRIALFDHLDPEGRVKEAERLQREYQKQQGGVVEDEEEFDGSY